MPGFQMPRVDLTGGNVTPEAKNSDFFVKYAEAMGAKRESDRDRWLRDTDPMAYAQQMYQIEGIRNQIYSQAQTAQLNRDRSALTGIGSLIREAMGAKSGKAEIEPTPGTTALKEEWAVVQPAIAQLLGQYAQDGDPQFLNSASAQITNFADTVFNKTGDKDRAAAQMWYRKRLSETLNMAEQDLGGVGSPAYQKIQ